MYHRFSSRNKIILVFLCLCISRSFYAQNKIVNTTDSTGYITFNTLITQLSKKYPVQFYYKPSWFAKNKFSVRLTSLPLKELLNRIKRLTGYTYLEPDSMSVVFVPIESEYITSSHYNENGEIIVGNPNEYGKYSHATIQGKVLDGKTEEPLPGAIVTIPKLRITLMTDRNGKFKVQLPVGEYEIQIKFMGYQESERKIKLVSNGVLSMEMFERSINVGEVVVSAERADLNVSRTEMNLVRFTARTIKELPASMGEIDIVKSLTLMPGIQSVGEFGSGFVVRGGSVDQNLIILNGIPLFNSSHLFGLTSSINPDAVKSVSLMKSGISAQYGERASSIMKIVMGSDQTDALKVSGSLGILDSRLNFQTPLFHKEVFFQVGARSSYSNWLLHQLPDNDLRNSSANFYDGNGLLMFTPNSSNNITAFGYISRDKFSFNQTTHYQYQNLLGSFKWNHVFNDYLTGVLTLGTSRYENDIQNLEKDAPRDGYQLKYKIAYSKFKWNFTWSVGAHSINAGLSSVLYNLNPGSISSYGITSSLSNVQSKNLSLQKALESSVYLSDNVNISEQFSTEIGLRFTNYTLLGAPTSLYQYKNNIPASTDNITDTIQYSRNHVIQHFNYLEPRISLRYKIDDQSSVKASYMRIHQFINLISNTAVISPTDIWQLSNPYIKPLRNDQFGIGYYRNFLNNKIESSIEIYYKSLHNIVDYKDGAQLVMNDHLETDLLNTNGYNYGLEFYLRKHTGKLTGWLSYTYSRSRRRTHSSDPMEQINHNDYYDSPYDQPHNLVLNGSYHITHRLRFSGTFLFNTGRPVTVPIYKYEQQGYQVLQYSSRNAYHLPAFRRLDLSITLDESLYLKKKWKGSWTFSIINVLGERNLYSVYYGQSDYVTTYQPPWSLKYNLFGLYIIGKPLPTLTYNFKF